MDKETLESRLGYLKITEEAIKHFEKAKEYATINRNNAIASNQVGAKQLYENQIKLLSEQVNFYMSVEDKIITELISDPEYKKHLEDIGMIEKEQTSINMR